MEDRSYIEDAWKEAWSFSGPYPPDGAEMIDKRDENGNTYYLYKMPDGSYLYDNDRRHAFALEMEAAQKRHERERRDALRNKREGK